MSWTLFGLLAAGVAASLAVFALPIVLRTRLAALAARLEREHAGRSTVLARGLVLGRLRIPAAVAADETGLDIRPVIGRSVRIAWVGVGSARWHHETRSGSRLNDPDTEGSAPLLTIVRPEGRTVTLAFRTSQAVPVAGALSRRLGDRAPSYPPAGPETAARAPRRG